MIEAIEAQELEEVKEAKINSLEDVCSYLRKIAYLKKKITENNDLADAEIERITHWRDKENKGIQETICYFETLLRGYYEAEKAKNPKYKCSTPYGRVSSHKQQPKYDYVEDKLVEWLKRRGLINYIETTEEPKWAEFKKTLKTNGDKAIDANGEIVDVIKVTPQPEKIEVIVE